MSSGRPHRRRPEGHHSFLADLRAVLAERNFRRLFATRLISQTGDGMFAAGLGAYVFFNATSFPNPGAAAAAFTVLYLPYSLVGPFAGVLWNGSLSFFDTRTGEIWNYRHPQDGGKLFEKWRLTKLDQPLLLKK